MDDNVDTPMEIFSQDGVYLTSAPASYMNYCHTSGTLLITEYLNTNSSRYIEWKPSELIIDSDVQDHEWAVVNTVERRTRTLSENSDVSNKLKNIKISFNELKSFKVSKNHQNLTFYDGKSEILISFLFQHGNCSALVSVFKSLMHTGPCKRDKTLFYIRDQRDTQMLDKSFAELNIFQDEPNTWRFFRNFQTHPYEATMEAFAKITNLVYTGPEGNRNYDDEVRDLINRSITAVDNNTTAQTHGEYEVIACVPKLPKRKYYSRGSPLNCDQWKGLQNQNGQIEDVEVIKEIIFRGGVNPSLRKEVWKFLLGLYDWDSTQIERQNILKQKNEEYYIMKLQWKSITKIQEENFSEYRERKSLIEKDVNRTDRTLDFYAGNNNTNLQMLLDILMTYVMYNFDLGYVQGMSDLLSPILLLLKNEVEAFWCFVGFMKKVGSNFDIDQAGMKEQLLQLHTLLLFVEPELADYLDKHDSGNMFFCFRWLLVWFKRELSQEDVMNLWEVMWTGLPCKNFHLLICVAILENEKEVLISNKYGFTEILKHINELAGHLNVPEILSRAEGIYNQIIEAEHLTDNIRIILGLPVQENEINDSTIVSIDGDQASSMEAVNFGPDEETFERSINGSYL